MKRVLTAAVLIPLVLLAVFRAPWWLFSALLLALIVLTLHEYLAIARAYGIEPQGWLAYTACILAGLSASLLIALSYTGMYGEFFSWPLFLSPFLLFGLFLVFRQNMSMALPTAAVSAFSIIYIAMPLGLLGSLRERSGVAVTYVLFSVWAGDIAAYYAGRSLGRHKLAPAVSPNKTWEGAIASVIASIAVTALVCHFRAPLSQWFSKGTVLMVDGPQPLKPMPHLPWLQIVIVGLITNVAAQFGDLFESAMKRGAHIKDSGSLVPGHGGVLDRIDALLFAIPLVWLYLVSSMYLEQPLFLP